MHAPSTQPSVVIIGAGPAGLTAAYKLADSELAVTVLEADTVVGGISRTVERDGWRFDIGGHRFFTKVNSVEALWHEILPDGDFLQRPRMSRIFYHGKFFDYPLKASNALRNLGPVEAARCVLSYLWARLHPPKDQTTFEGWTASRFGWRLYRMFFKTYTEKVWGIDASEIQADWAAQRIKNLSLGKAILNAVDPRRTRTDVTSLIEEFQYPKLGPGMMWERCAELAEKGGATITFEAPVVAVHHDGGRAVSVRHGRTGGRGVDVPADHVISSMPLPDLLRAMDPPIPADVRAAADAMSHRDYLTVALVIPAVDGFPDNWIYVHDPAVRLGRIQNYRSWSPYMVKVGYTCLGLEYFVFEGDDLWTMTDEDLIALGTRELATLGLVQPEHVDAGYVVRVPKAYPTYDEGYKERVDVLRAWLAEHAPNVHPVGRNGMHKYNNQDHSMVTAMLTVENIVAGAGHDVWEVNVEDEYHEETGADIPSSTTGRDAPVLPRRSSYALQPGGPT
ncbi:MAG: NAD(P)/FAD-dependent oxidoreductase [Acidimicrobiales bacterium]